MTARSRVFDTTQRDALLANPKHAALYLEECLVDGNFEIFQEALRNVAKAQEGGVKAVAEEAGLNRENLYRALSRSGKPQMETVTRLLNTMGLRLSIQPNS